MKNRALDEDIARVTAVAQKLAQQMGVRFVINPGKLSDFRRRALSALPLDGGL